MTEVLVIENHPGQGPGRLAQWLEAAGATLAVVRPHRGEKIPQELTDVDALVALGGGRGTDWADQVENLLREAVTHNTPTLAVCSSARLLATTYGGTCEKVTDPVMGPRFLAKRDVAGHDPIFGPTPMVLDAIWFRREDIVTLPQQATLLSATPHGGKEVFRIGECAWGIQAHFEFTTDTLSKLDGFDEEALQRAAEVEEHIIAGWQPVIDRFAQFAAGGRAATPLPLLNE